MYDYNASHLNYQATLLEEFHKIQRYLIEHPLYQIYQSSADYVAGVTEYYINEVSVREGGTLSVGDVVLFSNVYYGVITEINEETEMFTIAQGISFRGATGETGPRGGVGPRGLPGADGKDGVDGKDGTNGTDGKNGLSMYLYDGVLNEDTTTINFVDQIELPTGRAVEVGDLLLSTYASSFGAIAQVVGVDSSGLPIILTVDYIGLLSVGDYDNLENKPIINADLHSGYHTPVVNTYYRHTGTTLSPFVRGVIYYYDGNTYTEITGGGGGGVSDVQINGTTIVSDSVANIPNASTSQAGVVSTGGQNFGGLKTFSGGIRSFSSDTWISPLRICNSSSSGVVITYLTKGCKFTSQAGSDDSTEYRFAAGTGGQVAYISLLPGRHKLVMHDASSIGFDVVLPSEGGTLLSAPTTWSTGTSGSVTLPSAGLYEFKVTMGLFQLTTFVNWDGTNPAMTPIFTDGSGDAYLLGVVNGVIMVSPAGTEDVVNTNVSYRKIGIA